MSTTLLFTKRYFKRISSDYDALQDFIQNFGDQAFGFDQKLAMPEWLKVGIPRWDLNQNVTDFDFHREGRLVASMRIRKKDIYTDELYNVELINHNVVVSRDAFITMGYSTKFYSNLSVGCKGVGAKNAMGRWIASHGRNSLKISSGEESWDPHFNGVDEEGNFSISIRSRPFENNFKLAMKDVARQDIEKIFRTVLWMNPPTTENILFENENGQILSGSFSGKIFLYHNYITSERMRCGVNIFPQNKHEIQVTNDRQNIIASTRPNMLDYIANLWSDALQQNPSLISILYDAFNSEEDVLEKNLSFDTDSKQLLNEFVKRNGTKAYPIIPATSEIVDRSLKGYHGVSVSPVLHDILREEIGSPEDILQLQFLACVEIEITAIPGTFPKIWEALLQSVVGLQKEFYIFRAGTADLPFVCKVDGIFHFNSFYLQHDNLHDDVCVNKDLCLLGTLLKMSDVLQVSWTSLPAIIALCNQQVIKENVKTASHVEVGPDVDRVGKRGFEESEESEESDDEGSILFGDSDSEDGPYKDEIQPRLSKRQRVELLMEKTKANILSLL